MPLTDTAIRNTKPGAKPTKLFDERGLFILVTPAGGVSGGDLNIDSIIKKSCCPLAFIPMLA
jgi:hypothetical protein